ncbi:MAG: SpoVA/SpoVAEb family sporulation membrane protein [Bacillota bacterium]|nr:SpoVA/SpoVAEb family sporulation membrane protein [Bacillota bacterium]
MLAFGVGGTICALGQVVLLWLLGLGLRESQAGAYTSAIMIGVGATLTGLGIYDEIGSVGGMGSALPITGFANSIVSPAMEFKREGFILGVSAKMFNVAGPVIVYGLLSAALVTAALLVLR